MASIIIPNIIALDSATLGKLSRDFWSPDRSKRDKATKLIGELNSMNFVIGVSNGHIRELLQHQDQSLAEDRLRFLRTLKYLAWIRPYRKDADQTNFPGGVVDFDKFEISHFLRGKSEKPEETTTAIRSEIWRFGTGEELVQDVGEFWEFIRMLFMDGPFRSQYIASIARTDAGGVRDMKIKEFLDGTPRTAAERRAFSRRFHAVLRGQIETHGDKRMRDYSEPAAIAFMESVEQRVERIARREGDAFQALLAEHGIDAADIDLEMTIEEYGHHVQFAENLKIISRTLRPANPLTPAEVPQDNCPSWLLRRELQRIQYRAERVSGSDINDGYLANLVLYADFVEVDKRIREYLSRIQKSNSSIASLVNGFFSCPDYSQIPSAVAA